MSIKIKIAVCLTIEIVNSVEPYIELARQLYKFTSTTLGTLVLGALSGVAGNKISPYVPDLPFERVAVERLVDPGDQGFRANALDSATIDAIAVDTAPACSEPSALAD